MQEERSFLVSMIVDHVLVYKFICVDVQLGKQGELVMWFLGILIAFHVCN